MKRLMMVIVFSAAMQLVADTETVGEYTWTYRIKGDTAEIYNSYSTAVSPRPTGAMTIPDTLGGKPVTSIGDSAFNWCSGLTSVTIPDSVTSIGYSAFSGCSGLTSVTIPAAVKNIGSEAFAWCSGMRSFEVSPDNECYKSVDGLLLTKDGGELVSVPGGLTSVAIPFGVMDIWDGAASGCWRLMSITMPESVTRIGEFAFYSCDSLESVTIPAGVASIGKWAFSSCESLMSFEVSSDNESYKSVDGLILSSDGKELVAVPAGRTRVTIPAGVTSIGPAAFGDDYCISDVVIPDSVTNIGEDAFCGCDVLISVTIPNSVTNIAENAFNGCMSLPSVTIPDGVTSIGDYAFSSCESLPGVTIPDGVTSIGEGAFGGCIGLANVVIPANVTSIGIEAFYDCQSLTDAFLPVSLDGVVDVSSVFDDYTAIHFYSGSEPAYFTLTLDVNGGTALDEPEVKAYAGASVGVLPVPTRPNYLFLGWFTTTDGDDQVTEKSVVAGDMTLYAHWTESPFYATGGNATWWVDADGSWRSGAITNDQTTWAEILVTNVPCVVSFKWKASSESDYDKLYFYLDGEVVVPAISGTMDDWVDVSIAVTEGGDHTIRFEYTKDVSVSDGDDCGWVKDFETKTVLMRDMTLDANGGWVDGGEAIGISVVNGIAIGMLPTPIWDGEGAHRFLGWFTECEGGTEVTAEMPVSVEWTVLYAHWKERKPPANDNFANATEISGEEGSIDGTTFDSTREVADLISDRDRYCKSTVWYKWTAPSDGVFAFTVSDADAERGWSCLIAATAGYDVEESEWAETKMGWGSISIAATTGDVYWIELGSYLDEEEGDSEEFDFTLTWGMGPANDEYENSEILESSESGSVPGTLLRATIADNDCIWRYGDAARTVWYKWTAPFTGTVRFVATADNGQSGLLYLVATRGYDAESGKWDDCGYDWGRTVTFNVVEGESYYVSVATWNYVVNGFTLSWRQDVAVVTFDPNGGEGEMEPMSLSRLNGYEGTLASNEFARAGYDFAGWTYTFRYTWEDDDGIVHEGEQLYWFGDGESINAPYDENGQGMDMTLVAQWWKNMSVVTFDPGCDDYDGTMEPQTFAAPYDGDWEEKSLTSNAYARVGHTFVGWTCELVEPKWEEDEHGWWEIVGVVTNVYSYEDGEVISGFYDEWNDGALDVMLVAQWARNAVVTFDANGGEGEMGALALLYGDGYAAVLPSNTFTRTGYDFVGWSYEIADEKWRKNEQGEWEFVGIVTNKYECHDGDRIYSPLGEDTTLVAQWWKNTSVVTFDPGCDDYDGTMEPQTFATPYGDDWEEKSLTSNAYARVGYTFVGWTCEVVEPKWEEDAQGSWEIVGVVTNVYSYENGEVISGFYDEWNDGALDVTLVAQWEIGRYTVAFDYNGGTDAEGNEGCVFEDLEYGTDLVVPVATNGKCKFLGWEAEGFDFTGKVPAGDVTYVAKWGKSTIVTFDANGGECEESEREVNWGEAVGALPVAERDNHSFVGWTTAEGAIVTSAFVFANDDEKAMLTAQWTFNGKIDVRTAIAEGDDALGKVTGAKDAVKPGTKLTLKATANKGAAFAGWFTNDVLAAATASYSYVAGGVDDVAFEARFVSQADDELFVEGTNLAFKVKEPVSLALGDCFAVTTESALTSVSVSGLPSGVKYDTKTQKFSGAPTKAGLYYVTCVAKNGNGYQYSCTAVWNVDNAKPADNDNGGIGAGALSQLDNLVTGYAYALVGFGNATAVSGLPSGLKFDKNTGVVAGTPTKPGKAVVTFTGKNKQKSTHTVIVTDGGMYALTLAVVARSSESASATTKATVAGGGVYVVGKSVTVKATAAKGNVFAGWYDEDGVPLSGSADFRTASFPYVMGGKKTVLTATFASEGGDKASLKLVNVTNVTAAVDGSLVLDLGGCVESLSLPKLAVTGLPSGLKYDAKTLKVSGKATKPGVYKVKVAATNTSVKKATDGTTVTFELTVPNFESDKMPGLRYATDAYGTNSVGVMFGPERIDCKPADGWTVKVSGLPAGLKFDTKTGKIVGVPTKAGVFTVTFTLSKKGEKNQVATITLQTEALPAWAVGTFDGGLVSTAEADNGAVLGLAQGLTVSTNGKISGKVINGDGTWTLSAASFDSFDAVAGAYIATIIGKNGKQAFTNEVRVSASEFADTTRGLAEMVGDGAKVEAYQNLWKTEPWKTTAKGFSNKKLEIEVDGVEGAFTSGTLNLKFASSGTVTTAGKFVTGVNEKTKKDITYSASCSSVLIPQGGDAYIAYIYFPPKKDSKGNVTFAGYSALVPLVWDAEAKSFVLLPEE